MPKRKVDADPEKDKKGIVDTEKDKKALVDVTCRLAAVIPTGDYANLQPSYEITQSVDAGDESKSMDSMRALLQSKIELDISRVKAVKIKEAHKNLRITEHNGKFYPHVTTIQGAINPINYPVDKLKQYASRGSLVHAQIDHFFRTLQWEEDVLKIPGTKTDYMIVTQGDLNLSWKACNFMGFYQEYKDKMKVIACEEKVFNDEYMYCGSRDLKLRWDGKLSILDFKTFSKVTKAKIKKTWEQESAYAKCDTEKIEQLILVPLNPTSKNGYEKPIITTDIDTNFNDFLQDREAFKKIYNI